MNVLYDISVLGNGYADPRSRTGVFRVTENVALELARSPQCRVDFCATHSLASLGDAQTYLWQHPQLQQSHLLSAGAAQALHQLFWQQVRRINTSNITRWQRLQRRVAYEVAHWINQITPSLDRQVLPNYDIFHATFYPFPDVVQPTKDLKRFLTVYDLIPILFPQYFEQAKQHTVAIALNQLHPDDWVLCISEATRRDLCNYLPFLNPDQVRVTYLAASENFYPCEDQALLQAVRQKYGIPAQVPYLLSLGTLEPRKNIAHVVRCFGQLVQQEKLDDLYLVLVGTKGWDHGQIFAAIAETETQLNLQKRIITTGFVPDQDLAPIYSDAVAFVYPSLYEGFGLPPLEAMQCRIPVITSNTSSLPEVVGDAGVLLEPHDRDGLCQALLRLLIDPIWQRTLAERSYQRAQQFSWQRCGQQTLAAYQAAL